MDSKPQGKQRIYLWDNLKIILILFVVIHHASIPYVAIKGQHWTEDLYMLIIPFTMSTFTMISGYWFKQRPLGVIIKRYLFPCLLMIFLMYGLTTFWQNPPAIKYYRWRFDAMWYLWVLFIYCLITPKLLKYDFKVLLSASVFLSLVAGFFPFIGGAFSLSRMIGFYPFFLLGIKMSQSGKVDGWIRDKRAVRWARVIFVVTMLLFLLLFYYYRPISLNISFNHDYAGNWHKMLQRAFTYVVCVVLSISLIVSMPNRVCMTFFAHFLFLVKI